MKLNVWQALVVVSGLVLYLACGTKIEQKAQSRPQNKQELTAKDILGNPNYQAICYGGYRENNRDVQPSLKQLQDDLKILAAMNIKILRTYNTKLAEVPNLLKAIHALKQQDPNFEMYVMLGAWINCKDAWTPKPNHDSEDEADNAAEIQRAVEMTNQYPDIIKIIAVGNEAMVKWASSYFVQPNIILHHVNHLQTLKKTGKLPKDLWITSSDNFAAWGGGGGEYHVEDLTKLFAAVDYVSIHTYPMHETHYNPHFWGNFEGEENLSDTTKIAVAMNRAKNYAVNQYQNVAKYMKKLGIEKPIHIGETGWASSSDGFYGTQGTKACDEYKQGVYYKIMRNWTNENNIACFYFEAFDEIWKDDKNPAGSENHFGLFTLKGQAKYALWDWVDKGVFKKLSRDGNPILKTHGGNKTTLLKNTPLPPSKRGKAITAN